jgi:hypothetical protein
MDGPVITLFPLILDLADAIVTACGVYVAWMVMTGQTRFLALRARARSLEIRRFIARARRRRPAPAGLLTYAPAGDARARDAGHPPHR